MDKEHLERRITDISERLADAISDDRKEGVVRLTKKLAELKLELSMLSAPVVAEELFTTDETDAEFS